MAGAGAPIGPGTSGWLGRTPTSRRGGAGGVSEVDEPAFGQKDGLVAFEKLDLVDVRLDVSICSCAKPRLV